MIPDGYHSVCLLSPKLTGPAPDEFAADIKYRGLLQPIVLVDGQVLDGKNRLAGRLQDCRAEAEVYPVGRRWFADRVGYLGEPRPSPPYSKPASCSRPRPPAFTGSRSQAEAAKVKGKEQKGSTRIRYLFQRQGQ